MQSTFAYCEDLTTASNIPSGVTNMWYTFFHCESLVSAPSIPEGVLNMMDTFSGCTSLVNAPVIPSSVTNLYGTFYYCSNLTGYLTINTDVYTLAHYDFCLRGAATNYGCDLKLNGSSTMLSDILGTCNPYQSHISLDVDN